MVIKGRFNRCQQTNKHGEVTGQHNHSIHLRIFWCKSHENLTPGVHVRGLKIVNIGVACRYAGAKLGLDFQKGTYDHEINWKKGIYSIYSISPPCPLLRRPWLHANPMHIDAILEDLRRRKFCWIGLCCPVTASLPTLGARGPSLAICICIVWIWCRIFSIYLWGYNPKNPKRRTIVQIPIPLETLSPF